MPSNMDFRNQSQLSIASINRSGSFVGKKIYWKLYAIENIYRIIIHSILTAQIGVDWWNIGVDGRIKQKVEDFKNDYLKNPWHTIPGGHEIYYTQLPQLNEIARVNSHLFLSSIPDIDQWIARIDTVRLPRNIVGHMNFLNNTDKSRIDVLYDDFKKLFSLVVLQINLQIPRL
jgi:hypothetical protein